MLHRFFDKHADKIGKELLSLSKPSSEGDKSAVNGKRAWDGLCALLVDLGPPLEVPRPSNYTSQEHGEYIDLMADYHGRNTSRVKELFVEMDEVWVSWVFKIGWDSNSTLPGRSCLLRLPTSQSRRRGS